MPDTTAAYPFQNGEPEKIPARRYCDEEFYKRECGFAMLVEKVITSDFLNGATIRPDGGQRF